MDESDFRSYLSVKRGLTLSSIAHYVLLWRCLTKWKDNLHLPLIPTTIEQYLYQLQQDGAKPSTINNYICVFKQIDNYFIDRGNPLHLADGISLLGKDQEPIIILTPNEIERILSTKITYQRNGERSLWVDTLYRMVTMFLAFTGARISEALDLKVRHVDIEGQTIIFTHTKNKVNRRVFLCEPLLSVLKKHIKEKSPDDLVFCSTTGGAIHKVDYWENLKRRCKEAGITKRVHPHLFRHSFATHLLTSGVDITMVATILGHKDIQTTYKTYIHLAEDNVRKATMKHPLIRKSITPKEKMQIIRETLTSLSLQDDETLNYSLEEKNNNIYFSVGLK